MPVHIKPEDGADHVLDGLACWCDPNAEFLDPETGLPYPEGEYIVLHNMIGDYHDGQGIDGDSPEARLQFGSYRQV